MKVTTLNSLTDFPKDALIISYSDHYRGNSGDDIFLTNNKGKIDDAIANVYFSHWNVSDNDRGIISIMALTHEDGAFALYKEFKNICHKYVDASNDLKNWQKGDLVYNIQTDDDTLKYGNCGTWKEGTKQDQLFTGSKRTSSFENSSWYKRYSKRSKSETIERKRKDFEDEKLEFNNSILKLLENRKKDAAKWFEDNKISVRIAYIFLTGYLK